MDDSDLAEEMASVVGKHPFLYYSIVLNDSQVLRHPSRSNLFADTFCEVYNSYNDGLFNSIRLMIRYEKSLMAWSKVVSEIEGGTFQNTLLMDYVHPVFVVACDLPITFKDQFARGCAKIAAISKGNDSYLRDIDGKRRLNWFKEMRSVCSDTSLEKRLIEIVNDDLYGCPDAVHFRNIHGAGTHDLSRSLVSGVRHACSPAKGVVLHTYSELFNLDGEIEIMDRHRLRMQGAYRVFGEYADELYCSIKRNR